MPHCLCHIKVSRGAHCFGCFTALLTDFMPLFSNILAYRVVTQHSMRWSWSWLPCRNFWLLRPRSVLGRISCFNRKIRWWFAHTAGFKLNKIAIWFYIYAVKKWILKCLIYLIVVLVSWQAIRPDLSANIAVHRAEIMGEQYRGRKRQGMLLPCCLPQLIWVFFENALLVWTLAILLCQYIHVLSLLASDTSTSPVPLTRRGTCQDGINNLTKGDFKSRKWILLIS